MGFGGSSPCAQVSKHHLCATSASRIYIYVLVVFHTGDQHALYGPTASGPSTKAQLFKYSISPSVPERNIILSYYHTISKCGATWIAGSTNIITFRINQSCPHSWSHISAPHVCPANWKATPFMKVTLFLAEVVSLTFFLAEVADATTLLAVADVTTLLAAALMNLLFRR